MRLPHAPIEGIGLRPLVATANDPHVQRGNGGVGDDTAPVHNRRARAIINFPGEDGGIARAVAEKFKAQPIGVILFDGDTLRLIFRAHPGIKFGDEVEIGV